MAGAVSQRPKDFPGAAPPRKLEDVSAGLPSETCKCHQPGVADAKRRLQTDLHLVMGSASRDTDENSLKQSGGSTGLAFHMLLWSLGHFLPLEFTSCPGSIKPNDYKAEVGIFLCLWPSGGGQLCDCELGGFSLLCSCLLPLSPGGWSLRNGTVT